MTLLTSHNTPANAPSVQNRAQLVTRNQKNAGKGELFRPRLPLVSRPCARETISHLRPATLTPSARQLLAHQPTTSPTTPIVNPHVDTG
jgi:hypothetical protein